MVQKVEKWVKIYCPGPFFSACPDREMVHIWKSFIFVSFWGQNPKSWMILVEHAITPCGLTLCLACASAWRGGARGSKMMILDAFNRIFGFVFLLNASEIEKKRVQNPYWMHLKWLKSEIQKSKMAKNAKKVKKRVE